MSACALTVWFGLWSNSLTPSTVQKRRSKGTVNRNRLTCEFVKIKQSYSYIMPVYKCMYNFPQLTEVWFNKTSCTLPVTLEMEKINNALLLMYPSYLFTENTLRHFRDPGLKYFLGEHVSRPRLIWSAIAARYFLLMRLH